MPRRSAPGTFEVFTHGGRHATGIDAVAHARKLVEFGAGEILLTSMDRDGTKAGYNLALTRAVADAVSVPVIASGGVGTLEHLVEGRDAKAMPAPFWRPRSSISARRRSPRPRPQMAAAGLPVRPA